MHVHLFLYFYTLIGSSDSLDLHIQVYDYFITDQVFGEDHTLYEEPVVLSIRLIVFLLFLFRCFLDSRYIGLIACYIPLSICDHVWTLYVLLQWYW